MARPVTALVTGATGFIGSHLAERLVAAGMEVRCLVRPSSSRRYLPLSSVVLVEGDLATGRGLSEACGGADVVFHLAGATKARHIADYYRGNVEATASLVRASTNVPRLVHVSSLAAVGPSPDGLPLTEDATPHPLTHYGKSKLLGETIVRDSALCSRSVIVRPPVVYGPRDTDILPLFRAAARGFLPVIGGGERWFSAVYVKDLVEGLLAAAQCPAAAGRTYFIAHPRPVTWSEWGAQAAALLGRRARTVTAPRRLAWAVGLGGEAWSWISGRPGILSREKIAEAGCRYWTCDPARAAGELGFRAPTDLRQGMTETLAWYREAGWLK
jgi:nucleoside-diphosphate-sugar epimerase